MRVTAVIPCHNEAKTIAGVVKACLQFVDLVDRVIVVDNLSSDGTADIAAGLVGWTNIVQCSRKGAGISTRKGLVAALNVTSGHFAEAIVTLDGDGQHDPDDIPRLLGPLYHDTADIVIGSRFMRDYDCPRYRKLGIDVITGLYNLGNRGKVSDALSGFRAFSRKTVRPLLPTESGFSYGIEMLVKARARHLRMIEVPVRCVYHEEFSQNSTSNPVTMGIGIALKTVKWRVKEEIFS